MKHSFAHDLERVPSKTRNELDNIQVNTPERMYLLKGCFYFKFILSFALDDG